MSDSVGYGKNLIRRGKEFFKKKLDLIAFSSGAHHRFNWLFPYDRSAGGWKAFPLQFLNYSLYCCWMIAWDFG
jgi:hypothetical protein